MIDDDDRYDDEELARARALVALLDTRDAPAAGGGESRSPDDVSDALDAAQFIVASRHAQLPQARAEAVLRRIQSQQRLAGRRRAVRPAVAWLAGGLAAAAAFLLIVRSAPLAERSAQMLESRASPAGAPSAASGQTQLTPSRPSEPASPSEPVEQRDAEARQRAAAAVNTAQRAWLDAATPEAEARLDQSLREYRAAHFALLRVRYP